MNYPLDEEPTIDLEGKTFEDLTSEENVFLLLEDAYTRFALAKRSKNANEKAAFFFAVKLYAQTYEEKFMRNKPL